MTIDSEKMSTNDLHKIRKTMWDASIANHKKYINHVTNLFDSKFTEERVCPVCNSSEHRHLFYKSGGRYVACIKCQMTYLNPVFKDEFLTEYYRTNHAVQSEIVEMDNSFYQALYVKGLTTIEKFFSVKNNLLDVGCSAGTFLDISRKNGWRTFGLELNKIEAEVSAHKGHKVYTETIHKVSLDEKMDVISLWDVFEHIKDGYNFLIAAYDLLSSKGGIFIQSPTSSALAAKILQEKCNMFDGLEHVNLYSKENLEQLASRAGYYVASYETVISEIGVMNNYLQYEDPYLGSTNNKDTLLGILTADQLLDSNLGYKFQALLMKK